MLSICLFLWTSKLKYAHKLYAYKKECVLSSHLCCLSSELIDYHLETFSPKIAHTWKILEQFTFTQKLSRKKFK